MKQIIAIIAASLITAPASAYTAKDLRCVDRVMKKIVTEMAPTLVKKHGVRAVAGLKHGTGHSATKAMGSEPHSEPNPDYGRQATAAARSTYPVPQTSWRIRNNPTTWKLKRLKQCDKCPWKVLTDLFEITDG
jgi:hypothetical protein